MCNSGDCTLREAINAANVTDPVTIEGITQPGFAGSPVVEAERAQKSIASARSFNGIITPGEGTLRLALSKTVG
jgi:hypothetical protein